MKGLIRIFLTVFFVNFIIENQDLVAITTNENNQKIVKVKNKNSKNTSNNSKTNKKTTKKNLNETEEIDEQDLISSDFKISIMPSTSAPKVIIQDYYSGTILFEKNADDLISPSSMTKVATMLLVFEKIKAGLFSLEDKFEVSKNAFRKEGTTMFLKLFQKVSLKDLIQGAIIQSGNDASIVIAEGMCGSEEIFATELNAYVKKLGALNTNFVNVSGLPDPLHKTTVRDLLLLSTHLISSFPEYYYIFGEMAFEFNGILQNSKNLLLNSEIGCDGIKTGSSEGNYSIIASTLQNGRRIIIVAHGYKSAEERKKDMTSLFSWSRKMFGNQNFYKKGDIVSRIPVWYGKESYLPITVEKDIIITLPSASMHDVKVVLCYDTPISAPIYKGDQVGEIQLTSNSLKEQIKIPLVASISIDSGGFLKKIFDSIRYLVWGSRKPLTQ